ncbi:NAD(P)-dependent oxidoreductase [Streptomyces sp. AC495_CC817]|uniref:NAD-dependent epimerase/dehydratase family protein n=1 Tax=Streptomyces sp. AC495_CC817 TaxID=2823900 RepID=UPI001C277712|nr:NAD-dependent epimerase/dehydratase family protein [Streptomyces sp. AC495_CC817]
MSASIAVVGGTGLLGWQIASALRISGRTSPRVISRRRPAWLPPEIPHVVGDVTHGPDALARSAQGCSAIVNAASYVGDDVDEQVAVNVEGAAAATEAAALLGGVPLVHMSTAGVYGTLPFSGGDESSYETAPESELSRSRARGDAIAEDAGASLVRPLFVTGVGDTHFLLPLLRVHAALGAWIDDGRARLSVTSAEAVGLMVAGVVGRALEHGRPALLHAVSSAPVSVRDLVGPLLSSVGVPVDRSVSLREAVEFLQQRGIPERKVAQFASDYFIRSTACADEASNRAARMPPVAADAAAWYRARLADG